MRAERDRSSLRGVDHVAFAFSDFAAARDRLARLGFCTPPPGVCRWTDPSGSFEARSLSVMFRDTYLDFIQTRNPDVGLRPSGVVLGTNELSGTLAELDERGLERLPEYTIERRLDGAPIAPIGYRIAALDLRPHAGVHVSLLQDLQPEALRRGEWLSHANAADALLRIDCATPDLAAIRAWSVRVFGPGRVARTAGRVVVESGTAQLGWRERSGRAHIEALSLRSADLPASARALRAAGIAFLSDGRGLRVEPEAAFGCALELVEGSS